MEDRALRRAADPAVDVEDASVELDAEPFVLRSLNGRNLLFSEERQAVFELDAVSAYVWESINAGVRPELVVRGIVEAGLPGSEASALFSAAVAQLRSVSAVEMPSDPRLQAEPSERLDSVRLEIAGVAAHLHLSGSLVGDVRRLFGHLERTGGDSDHQLCARMLGGRVEVFPAGEAAWSCGLPEFIPLLKAHLIETVLRFARYEVALHAAALVREERVLLLIGSPGAGKTTLGVALTRAGFEMAADDVVLMDESGCVSGIPFPFAAKAGSWPLISRDWPEVGSVPIYRRPDGHSVRYLLPEDFAASRPSREVAAVVLLDRTDRECSELTEIDPTLALAALIAEGATRDQRLSRSGFTALVEVVQRARCFELNNSSLPEATALLRGLCP